MNKFNYIAVVGGVNIDIFGRPDNKLIAKDSNIGKVTLSMGGVGRNIAHNLKLMECNVKFITCIASDIYGDTIKNSCNDLAIDISHCLKVENARTSTYMYISDEQGEMQLAISDMDIYQQLTPELISKKLSILNDAEAVIIDTNLRQDTIEYIAKNITSALIVDPVSTTKAKKITNILDKITILKPNILEAELLSGVKILDEKSLKKAADILISKGIKQVYISLGSQGVYCNENSSEYYQKCFSSDIKNTTGAGDSFVAGLGYSLVNNYGLKRSAQIGLAMASICVSDEQTISQNINITSVENIIKRHENLVLGGTK